METSGLKGTLSLAKVHNEVRLDLRQDDIAREGRTIRRHVLAPLVRWRFGPTAPVPFFQRRFDPMRDRQELADVLNVAVNDLHMKVPAAWAHEALSVPQAAANEPALQPRGTGASR